jgi:hypothetical protein
MATCKLKRTLLTSENVFNDERFEVRNARHDDGHEEHYSWAVTSRGPIC